MTSYHYYIIEFLIDWQVLSLIHCDLSEGDTQAKLNVERRGGEEFLNNFFFLLKKEAHIKQDVRMHPLFIFGMIIVCHIFLS